jgi:HSP20 family protein
MTSKGTQLQPTKVESIIEEMEGIQDRIMKRAYDLFLNRGGFFGRDLDDWLEAEAELTGKPAVELNEKGGEFVVQSALAGVEPKDLDIRVTPLELLIEAETKHEHSEEKGTVHLCEFRSGKLLRCIQFPKQIDPDKVKAEFREGILRVSAAIAKEEQQRKVQVTSS